ncbi:MAG: YcaO-like family protein [Candidatus Paceibacterota bacterium]
MKYDFRPIFTAPSIIKEDESIFHKIDETITIKAPSELVKILVSVCDGEKTLDEIVELLSNEWDETTIKEFIEDLHRHSVLLDSRFLSDELWSMVKNPSYFPVITTNKEKELLTEKAKNRHKSGNRISSYKISSFPLAENLKNRSSIRSFSEKSVAKQDIIDILWSVYGEVVSKNKNQRHRSRTVPSAGALYPLIVHVVLFRKSGDLSPSIYRVHLGAPESVSLEVISKDINKFFRSFLDPLAFNNSHGVIIISGSFKVSEEKYGNRSLLYVPIEAGHAAQNAHLSAIEKSISTLEFGGFIEDSLKRSIKLPESYIPLTTIFFGYKGDENIKDDIEVDWAIPIAGDYNPPFSTALCRISKDINEDWSYGRDSSPELAKIKAISEAKEWAACGCVPGDLIKASFLELSNAIDPRSIVSFHPDQYEIENFPLYKFNEETRFEWVEAKDLFSGESMYVFADHVYFPYFPDTLPYVYSNSSGVAAHPSKQKAIELSTLELVERDSFMIHYLADLCSPSIIHNTLPDQIQERVQELERIGFKVWIQDHSLDLAPVAFVMVQNDKLGYTNCASSSSFDIEGAISHALMEVESSVLARLQNGSANFVEPKNVVMPLDHGALYEQRKYFRKADFMISKRDNNISFQNFGGITSVSSWEELLNRFREKSWRLLTIPLYLSEEFGGNGSLSIVRSIVPGIVPMTFGYRQEPGGMNRIYKISNEFGNKKLSYYDLTKFPHPFA